MRPYRSGKTARTQERGYFGFHKQGENEENRKRTEDRAENRTLDGLRLRSSSVPRRGSVFWLGKNEGKGADPHMRRCRRLCLRDRECRRERRNPDNRKNRRIKLHRRALRQGYLSLRHGSDGARIQIDGARAIR